MKNIPVLKKKFFSTELFVSTKTDLGEVEFIESVLCRSIDDTIVWKNLKLSDKNGKTYTKKVKTCPA